MRVAIVQETIELSRGGAETSTRQMAGELAALGLDVTVVCATSARQDFGGDASEEQGVRYQPLAVAGLCRTQRSARFLRSATQFCERSHFDIVHAVSPCLAADVYQPRGGTLPETIRRSTAMVRWGVHRRLRRLGKQLNMRQRLLGRLERQLLTQGGARVHVAALSEYVRRQVMSDYGVSPERVALVFNGVEVKPVSEGERVAARAAVREEVGVPPSVPLVLFVAHNFRLKGLAELLRATAVDIEAGPVWQLAVVGRDAPDRYMRLARRLGVADRVHFVGPRADLRAWYSGADALAHPTWYDPCSRVVLEALGSGLPVVTTRWNGAAEVLKRGTHGEVVDGPEDVAGLAAAIRRTLEPHVRLACIADAGRVCELVSMGRHARELLALYERILVKRAGATFAGNV